MSFGGAEVIRVLFRAEVIRVFYPSFIYPTSSQGLYMSMPPFLFLASLLITLCALLVALQLNDMPTQAAARASNANYKPTYRPVGLFFGGTSGIGQAMAEKLAAQTAGRAHIIVLGRNQQAAERIISGFPKHNDSLYEFERIDATSMKDVRRVTRSLLNRLDKANFVITSPGFMTLKGRDESEDGLDKKLACHVYARFRFALDLVPLLEKAADAGEAAAFMSVMSAGKEPTSYLNLDDLGLKKEYSLTNAAAVASHYTDAYIEVRYGSCAHFWGTHCSSRS